MLDLYKGIKIEDEVIIVEKQNAEHQGYLVSANNEKQLETALNWAGTSIYDESIREAACKATDKSEKDKLFEQYWATRKDLKGVVHKYKNGQFKLTLCESAEKSWSQGGKLSFWNCLITCPDGNTFLIGINSECLLSLLKNTDFIKGECQSNLWLGRIKNNVGAFTEDMDEFKDGKKDQAIRDTKMTANYSTTGQILKTKSDAFVYLGEWYKHFTIYNNRGYGYSGSATKNYPKFFMVVHSNPKKMYGYKSIVHYDNRLYSVDEINNDDIYPYNFINSKKKCILTDEVYKLDINSIINYTVKYCNHEDDDYSEWNKGQYDPARYYNYYHDWNEYKDCPKNLLKGNVFKKCFTQDKNEDLAELIKIFTERGGKVFYDLEIPKELVTNSYYDLDEVI